MIYKGLKAFDVYRENLVKYPCTNKGLTAHIFPYLMTISERLCEQPIFTATEKEEVILIMSYLKKCGIYAQKFNCEEIPEDDVDIEKAAYVRDNLYDIICDKIGKLYKENPYLIPYERNNNIKR